MLFHLNIHIHFKLGRAAFEPNACSQWCNGVLLNRLSVSLKIKPNRECILSDFGVPVFKRNSASIDFKNQFIMQLITTVSFYQILAECVFWIAYCINAAGGAAADSMWHISERLKNVLINVFDYYCVKYQRLAYFHRWILGTLIANKQRFVIISIFKFLLDESVFGCWLEFSVLGMKWHKNTQT